MFPIGADGGIRTRTPISAHPSQGDLRQQHPLRALPYLSLKLFTSKLLSNCRNKQLRHTGLQNQYDDDKDIQIAPI